MIIREIFHGMISLNLVLLLLILDFVGGPMLALMYISHRKYQVKPYSYPWFSAAFAAAIAHRNHFFPLYQQNKPYTSKVKFKQASNLCKRVFEALKRD